MSQNKISEGEDQKRFETLLQNAENFKSLFHNNIEIVRKNVDLDLLSLLEVFTKSIDCVRKKINVILDKELNQYNLNHEKYIQKIKETLRKSEIINDSRDLHTATQTLRELDLDFSFLNNFGSEMDYQCRQVPEYISYKDETHSFNQVVQIMNKSLKLFEEHFEDLLKVTNIKDLSSDKYLHVFFDDEEISEDRSHLYLKKYKPNLKLEFVREIVPDHTSPLNSIVMLNDDIVATSSIDRTIKIFSLTLNKVI